MRKKLRLALVGLVMMIALTGIPTNNISDGRFNLGTVIVHADGDGDGGGQGGSESKSGGDREAAARALWDWILSWFS